MMTRQWTERELDELRESFGRIPAKQIASKLGRSTRAVHEKAQELRLTSRLRKPEEQYVGQADIAQALGVSRTRVSQIEIGALRKIRAEVEREADLAGVTPMEWLLGDCA